jgi:2-dehydropantoate 2-reductase
LRFVVIGAGAIGGTIAGRLFEHHHDVALVARGDHHDVLARRGLRLESPEGATTLRIPTVSSVDDIVFEDDDVAVIAVKGQDTVGVIGSLAANAPVDLPVVCAQNGVENERVALRRFSRVYGISMMCPTTHLEPGVVQAHSSPVTGILDLGRWPSGADALGRAVAEVFKASTFESRVREDIARWKWGKLLRNLGNAVEAICGPPARSGEIMRRVRAEAVACFEVGGIDYVGPEEDAARRGDLLKVLPVAGQARGGSSSWQSLARATGTIETDYLNGEIVMLGRLHGVPTPTNALVQVVANELARQRRAPGSITETELLRRLD